MGIKLDAQNVHNLGYVQAVEGFNKLTVSETFFKLKTLKLNTDFVGGIFVESIFMESICLLGSWLSKNARRFSVHSEKVHK